MNDAAELLDLRRLRHLVVLVDVGSFTAAADQLGLSQPGLSSSIRRLEAEVGTVLLEREPRVRPTSAGAELVRAARSLLAGPARPGPPEAPAPGRPPAGGGSARGRPLPPVARPRWSAASPAPPPG